MNPYQFETNCQVCGEVGACTGDVAAASWYEGNTVSHANPAVCRDNLARKKRELEQKEKELADKIKDL